MTITTSEYARGMVEKYKRYNSNLQYNMDTNGKYLKDSEIESIKRRIATYNEVIEDFEVLTNQ